MKNLLLTVAVAAACIPCIEWTRLSGTVKDVNQKESTLTIQNKEGDLLTIPIDYQVQIVSRKNITHVLKDTHLDDKVTLIRTRSEKPKDDSEGLVPPKYPSGI